MVCIAHVGNSQYKQPLKLKKNLNKQNFCISLEGKTKILQKTAELRILSVLFLAI